MIEDERLDRRAGSAGGDSESSDSIEAGGLMGAEESFSMLKLRCFLEGELASRRNGGDSRFEEFCSNSFNGGKSTNSRLLGVIGDVLGCPKIAGGVLGGEFSMSSGGSS